MANDPAITYNNGLAIINGKTYRVLRRYSHYACGEPFFLALAGNTRLKADDLAKHWKVLRHGTVFLAFATRPFSYHLIDGHDTDVNWPGFKAAPERYAFVGPTHEAVKHQISMVIQRYQLQCDPEHIIGAAYHVQDSAGSDVPAYLVFADDLK